MANIIDELVVTLGLDAGKFRNEAAQTQAAVDKTGRAAVVQSKALEDNLHKTQAATDKRLKQTVDVGRQSAQEFNKFRVEVAALFTSLATGFGLTKFIASIASADANVGLLAQRLGMSTKDLAAWQEASKLTGGSAEATGAAFEAMSRDFQNYKITGQSEMLPWLQTLGIAWETAEGKMRPMGEIYMELAKKYQTMSLQQANAVGAHFHQDPGLVALLHQGPARVGQDLDEMKRQGLPSDEEAAAALKFENNMREIERRTRDLGRAIFNDLAGPIDDVVKRMGAWYEINKNWLKADIEKGLKEIIVDVKAFAEEAGKVVDAVGGWKNATEILFALWIGEKFLKVAANIGGVLRLLAMVPGSGISLAGIGAELALLGVAGATYSGFRGAQQSGEDVAKQAEAGNIPTGFDDFGNPLGFRKATPEEMSGGKPGTIGDVWRHFVDEMRGVVPSPGDASSPRGIRNNNPLNLGYFPGQPGVLGKEAGNNNQFGVYPDMATGIAAEVRQLAMYQDGGLKTVRQLVSRWVSDPKFDNTGYVNDVAKAIGVGPDQPINIRDPRIAEAYIRAAALHESGAVSQADVSKGVSMGLSYRDVGGSTPLPPAGRPQAALDPALARSLSGATPSAMATLNSNRGPISSDNSSEVNVNGDIHIVTQATDSGGIARSLVDRMKQYALTSPANRGLA